MLNAQGTMQALQSLSLLSFVFLLLSLIFHRKNSSQADIVG